MGFQNEQKLKGENVLVKRATQAGRRQGLGYISMRTLWRENWGATPNQ